MRAQGRSRRGVRVSGLILTAALAPGAAWPADGPVELDRLAARVGKRVILLSDVRLFVALGLAPRGETENPLAGAVEWLVDRTLMLEEVERFRPPEPAAAAVRERVAAIANRLGEGGWARLRDREGVSDAWLEAIVRDTIRLEAYVRQRFGALAQPSDEDVRAYYVAHPEEFGRAGVVPPFERVEAEVRVRLAKSRLDRLVADWVRDLRTRAEVDVRVNGRPSLPPLPDAEGERGSPPMSRFERPPQRLGRAGTPRRSSSSRFHQDRLLTLASSGVLVCGEARVGGPPARSGTRRSGCAGASC